MPEISIQEVLEAILESFDNTACQPYILAG